MVMFPGQNQLMPLQAGCTFKRRASPSIFASPITFGVTAAVANIQMRIKYENE
jgi:hypothetical protein